MAKSRASICRACHPLAAKADLGAADLNEDNFASVGLPVILKGQPAGMIGANAADGSPIVLECESIGALCGFALCAAGAAALPVPA